MIAIKEMNIPKRCEECKFCLRQGTNDYGSFGECLLQKSRVNCLNSSRDTDCPLVEIVTCKDCKHNYEDTCDFDGLGVCDEYFCANGKRKEEEEEYPHINDMDDIIECIKYADSVQPKPKTDVLDKIRAEIESIERYGTVNGHDIWLRTPEEIKKEVLKILDKCKTESEDKE